MRLPLAKGSYSRSSNVPTRVVNMLYEQDPTNLKDGSSLLSRPGYALATNISASGIRLLFTQVGATEDPLGGYVFSVTKNNNLYKTRLPSPPGATVLLGTAGQAQINWLNGNGSQLLGSEPELVTSDGLSLTTISRTFMDNENAGMSWIFGNYGIVIRAGSGKFYWSALTDFSSWDALDFATADSSADGLGYVWSLQDFLFLGGATSIEVWSLSGNADLPFTRNRGTVYGCGIRDGLAIYNNEVAFFIGGKGGIWRMQGGVQKISPPWIDELVEQFVGLNAYIWQCNGHVLYVLSREGGGAGANEQTLVWDDTTGQWLYFNTYGQGGFKPCACVPLGTSDTVFGDPITGNLYLATPNGYTDQSQPVVREWTALWDVDGTTPFRNAIVDCSVGVGTLEMNPRLEMRVSYDSAKTWTEWDEANLGYSGDFDKVVNFRRFKAVRRDGAVLSFRYSAATDMTVRAVSVNEKIRG